jgi:hypothetical protein
MEQEGILFKQACNSMIKSSKLIDQSCKCLKLVSKCAKKESK